jgi:hypothetical protein
MFCKAPERFYRIVRKLEDGQEVFVASRNNLVEAKTLADSLIEYWPGDYSIQGPESSSQALSVGGLRSPEMRENQ